MRFLCDQQVDAQVAVVLRRLGHDAWTVANAGRSRAQDDELTVYSDDRDAVLVSHDVEFSERRRRNVVGGTSSCGAASGKRPSCSNATSMTCCRC